MGMQSITGRLFGKHKPQKPTTSGERETGSQAEAESADFEINSRMLTGFMRDLYAVEGKKRGLVDFDLAPVDERFERLKKMISSNPTREETSNQFWVVREVREDLANTPRPSDDRLGEQYDFLRAKLLAIETVREKKMIGDDLPFDDYLELTQGITPEVISEEMLEAQLDLVKNLYKSKSVANYDRDSILQYKTEQQVPEEEIAGRLKEQGDRYLKTLSRFLGEDIAPNYRVETDIVNEYWVNWAKGVRDDFTLTVNLHQRHAGKWTRGKIEEMSLHEIVTHFGQMFGWQKSIDQGKMVAALGITSITDPEQVTSEGIAQAMYYFVPEIINEISEEGILEIEQNGLRQMVYNNVHILLNTPGYPHEAVYDYVKHFLPAEGDEDIKKHIEDRTEDNTKLSYLLVYGYGYYLHREYSLCLNSDGKRELLKYIFSQPTTPEQEYNFFMNLVNDTQDRYGTERVPFSRESKDDLKKVEIFAPKFPLQLAA